MRWKERIGSRLFAVRIWAWTHARAAAEDGVDFLVAGSLDAWGESFSYLPFFADCAGPKSARITAHVSSSSYTPSNTTPSAERFPRWEVGIFGADAGQYPPGALLVDDRRAQNLPKNFLAGRRSVFYSVRSGSIGDLDVGIICLLTSTDGFYASSCGNHTPSAASRNMR